MYEAKEPILDRNELIGIGTMGAPSATCTQHSTRDAVGICVRCRTPLCSECITKLDGINHCRRCLEALAPRAREHAASAPSGASTAISIGLGFSLLGALMWLLLEVLLPGRGSK